MDTNIKSHDAVTNERGTYVRTLRDDRLERGFDNVWARATDPNTVEGRCLVLVGESGAGKSRALERLFRKRLPTYGSPDCDLVSLSMPSPVTLKVWGRTLLSALGYPLKSNLGEAIIWEMVRDNLATSTTKILHFDEFQHVVETANALQKIAVLNTIKSLLIGIGGQAAPVNIVLSGLPAITSFIEADPQVRRRCIFVRFETLNPALDGDVVEATITRLAAESNCVVDDQTLSDLAKRVLHAATGQLGQSIDLVREAIAVSVAQNDRCLGKPAFAEALEVARGNCSDFNPFVAEDWAAIDAGRVLLDDEGAYPVAASPSVSEPERRRRGRRAA